MVLSLNFPLWKLFCIGVKTYKITGQQTERSMNWETILHFWFQTLTPEQWFQANPQLDQLICNRFETLHTRAAQGELFQWREQPQGRLAEIIILDQFSRNIYRGLPQAFAQDTMALVLAQETIEQKLHHNFTIQQKMFLYMPYMHSESANIHEKAVQLFSEPGLEYNLDYEYQHKKIIDRFGRYPHRNQILGRKSTKEELAFLQEPNSSF